MAGTSYTRQSSFSDGDTISASLFNNEYNRLVNAFSYASSGTTGHRHDGTSGEGGNIHTIGDQDFLNKIVVDSTNNRWGFFVQVSSSAVEQIRIQDGAIVPVQDNDIDLGTSSLEFKDGYFDGTLYADAINFNGTAISATAAELNILDGVTSTTAELNILDGVTSTTAELNILDGVTSTTAELNILDGVTSTTAELNILDGVTSTAAELNYSDTGASVGTVVASKVVTVDSNKDVASFRNITLTGELDAGSLDISGDADIDGTLETDALSINGTSVTATAAELNILDGVTSTAAELNILDGVTSTTAELNILDGVTSTTAELNILDGVTATTAELNILDGVTVTAAEINTLDGITAVLSELNALDLGSTAVGTAIASKAVILDSNKDYTGIRNFTITGELDAATLDISGDVDVDGTTNLDVVDIDGAVDMASTLAVGGVVTANAGVVVDNITIDGTEIDLSSGALTLDVAGDINLDADGGNVIFKDGGTEIGLLANTSSNFVLMSRVDDKDIIFKGKDDGSTITALTLDMSAAGAATFNDKIIATELDISGNIDVDGTANLDVVDIDGAVDMASTLAVAGKVGIGVSSPTQKVDISGGGLQILGYITTPASGTSSVLIDYYSGIARYWARGADGSTRGSHNFYVLENDGGNQLTALSIDSSANATFVGEVAAASLDISGNVDIDGTTNLDVVDIDGAVNMASTLTSGTDVGVNSEYAVLGDDTSNRQLKFSQYQTGGSYDNAGHKINATSGYGELALAVGGTNTLTLDASQNATFAGNLDVDGSAGIYQRNSSGGIIVLDDTDTADASTPMVYFRNTAGQLSLGRANRNASTGRTTGSTDSLTISSAGDATFAGNVGISSGTISLNDADTIFQIGSSSSSTPTIQIRSGTSGTGKLWFGDNSGSSTARYDGFLEYGQTDQYMRFGTASTERMRLNATGLGIGTTSPSSLLHLEAAGSPTVRLVDTTNSATLLAYAQNSEGVVGTYSNHNLLLASNSTTAVTIDTSQNVGIGVSNPSDYYAQDLVVTGPSEGGITIAATGDHTNYLLFADSTSGVARYAGMLGYSHPNDLMSFRTNSIERMVIDSNGDVGIGTTSPNHNLHVYGASGSITNMTVGNPDVALRMSAYGSSHSEIRVETNHDLLFKTNGNSEKMRIEAGGNVGIGTSSPGNILEVAGASPVVEINATSGVPELQFSDGGTDEFSIMYDTGANGLKFIEGGVGTKMIIKDGGNVGIGTTSPSSLLDVAGTVTCTSLVETSDAALKMDVAPIKNALDTVSALRGVTYKDKKTGDKRLGFIAQDVAPVLPELVDESGDFLALRYGNTVGLLVEAIKEQSSEIQALTKRVEELED